MIANQVSEMIERYKKSEIDDRDLYNFLVNLQNNWLELFESDRCELYDELCRDKEFV